MIKMPRSQTSIAKNMIYPQSTKIDNTFHKQNIKSIKLKQVENKIKKEHSENYVKPEPYKLKQFTNVPSKVFMVRSYFKQKDNHKQTSLAEINHPRQTEKIRSLSNNYKKYNQKTQRQNDENIYSVAQTNSVSTFDAYYQNKKNKETKEEDIKVPLKGPTPRANDLNQLANRVNKNYIADNRISAVEVKQTNKILLKEHKSPEVTVHKDFGKTPEYLQKYKIEAQYKKELEKQMEEEAKYPKGTRLLSDQERLSTLAGLEETRKEIMFALEKLPISMKTLSMQNRKTELENKIDEIEKAIRTFSKKQVYVKIDQS